MKAAWIVHPSDNVATVLQTEVQAGQAIPLQIDGSAVTLQCRSAVPFGHKIAVRPIAAGAPVVKYGVQIGTATRAIEPGEHVHVHNVESNRGRGDRLGREVTK